MGKLWMHSHAWCQQVSFYDKGGKQGKAFGMLLHVHCTSFVEQTGQQQLLQSCRQSWAGTVQGTAQNTA